MRSENEGQLAWVASTCISLRCIFYLHIYSIQIYLYLCIIAYISYHFITFQRPRTRPVAKPLRSIRPEHRGPYTILTHSHIYGYEGRWMVILWWLLFAPLHPKSTIFAWEEDRPAGMTDAWLLIVPTPCTTGWPSWSLTTRKTFKLLNDKYAFSRIGLQDFKMLQIFSRPTMQRLT